MEVELAKIIKSFAEDIVEEARKDNGFQCWYKRKDRNQYP